MALLFSCLREGHSSCRCWYGMGLTHSRLAALDYHSRKVFLWHPSHGARQDPRTPKCCSSRCSGHTVLLSEPVLKAVGSFGNCILKGHSGLWRGATATITAKLSGKIRAQRFAARLKCVCLCTAQVCFGE